jgi:hypothetical protein
LCEELFGPGARDRDAAPATRQYLAEIIKREGRDRIWP